MAEGETGDRTEAASARRLQRAREEGQSPVSREVATWAMLAAAGGMLVVIGPASMGNLARHLSVLLENIHRESPGEAGRIALWAAALAAAPFLLGAALVGAASFVAQSGPRITPGKLRPDLSRLSPLAGIKRLFGPDGLVEAVKSIVKIAAICAAIWFVLRGEMRVMSSAPYWTLAALLGQIGREVGLLLMATLGVQLLIAAADVAWVRLRHAQSLKMSRFDIKQEHRESDGDPRIKARIRQLRAARAKRRMLAQVARATVVVTNPTHYAVALVYDRTRNAAPRVVAKGVDSMAARIRDVAARHRVPLVANPPLARALHQVDLDSDIPPEHFQAVAQIIAYVWGLQRRAAGRP